MVSRKSSKIMIAATLCVWFPNAVSAGLFTEGNLAVFRAEENDSNSPASIVEIDTVTANQSSSNVIAIPSGTSNSGLRFSGSASSTGYLSHTDDRTLLTFNGVNTDNTSSNVNGLNPRGVGTLDASGTYALQTTYTGTTSGSPQTRSSTSLNNSTWYIADQNGIYSNGTVAPSPSGNFRGIKSFGGTVFVMQSSTGTVVVNTLSAATGGTVTGLPGLTVNTDAQDFYMVQSGTNGSLYDVLYITATTSGGTILKYSLVSGSWSANGTYSTAFGGFGIAAQDSGDGAELFVTSGNGAASANSVIKLTDTAGYNQTISITGANNVTLYTAPTGTLLKGIDFAPIAVIPEPRAILFGTLVCGATGLAVGLRRFFGARKG